MGPRDSRKGVDQSREVLLRGQAAHTEDHRGAFYLEPGMVNRLFGLPHERVGHERVVNHLNSLSWHAGDLGEIVRYTLRDGDDLVGPTGRSAQRTTASVSI